MENLRIKNIMRGHLISIDAKPTNLKKFGDEFYKTRYWNMILGKTFVSFKNKQEVFRFNFDEIKKFFLKDSCVFVIDDKDKKRHYFKIL